MEAFRIHEDQENRGLEIKYKQNIAPAQKRTVLGLLNHNVHKNDNLQGKQPFASKAILKGKNNNENINFNAKENKKNLADPVVPVAQFEAFKVYEDSQYEERMAKIDEKLKNRVKRTNSLVQVYKGTAEDRFYTKTEVQELERKLREETTSRENDVEDEPVTCLMSVEKTLDDSLEQKENVLLQSSKSTKDIFFEMKEYRDDIYKYLREHELRHRPKPGYMRKQPDVTSNMRTILVDWLVEVTEEYKLHTETLYLAVNFIDRFLSYMSVVRAKLQLVGTAAMFLASKYEEIYPPEIGEFVYITDDTYNKRQVIRMEHLILKVLGYDLSVPTPLTFITATCVSNNQSEKTMYLAMYLSELALLNGDVYLEFLPSVIAASAIAIARHTLEEPAWSTELEQTTSYSLKDLKAAISFLNQMFLIAPSYPQHAIQDKYKSQKYLHVSLLKPNESQIDFD